MASLEGQQLGPYTVIAQMGSGGMATVYKAYHPRLDRYVAIKMLHEAFQEDKNFLARFEREAQIVARLEHPHIVPVFDFDEFNGRPYLVMKYIEGQTLKAVLEAQPLTLDDILNIMPPIAAALDYAHQQGVLHRDIKPSNIIIDTHGVPYLTDFGLARMAQLGESTLSHDVLLGTPHYISPEQAMGNRDLDSRTDLYSLGVVLYELVVGRVPFSADTPFAIIHDHIYRQLPKPSAVNPEITPQVDMVLEKALAKSPADRYTSASEMIEAFRTAAQSMSGLNPDRVSVASESLAKLRDVQNQSPPAASIPMPAAPSEAAPPIQKGKPRINASLDFNGTPKANISVTTPKRVVERSFDFSNAGKALENVGEALHDAFEGIGISFDKNTDLDMMPMDDEEAIRRRIEQQFNKRKEFFGHLVAFVFVNAILWVIYGATSGFNWGNPDVHQVMQLPWPLIVTLAWGSGLAAHFIELIYTTGRRANNRLRTIQGEFYRVYGENWQNADRKELRRIRGRVSQAINKRREFFQHIVIYAMINLMLWMIYGFSANIPWGVGEAISQIPFPWPILVTLGWGIGIVIHGFETLTASTRERAITRAVEREREMLYSTEKPKRERRGDPRVRLTEDGEFTDSMIEEIDADEKPKRRRR